MSSSAAEVSIVVPFRAGEPQRDRNWAWLKARYRELYPDWEIVEGTCSDGAWRKGVAVNTAAERASGDVLVIADADVLVGRDALLAAVEQLERAPWVIPHRMVYRLTEKATQAVISEGLWLVPGRRARSELVRGVRRGPAGGGISVTRHDDFEAVGGIDERFEGWGGEDISFARALDTLIGPHFRMGEAMWHLHHKPMPRRESRNGDRASAESEALAARYLDASGDPVAMTKLCEQRPYPGVMGGGIVAARREVVHSIPLDERFAGWG